LQPVFAINVLFVFAPFTFTVVPKALVSVVNAMLSFVNEHTRKKFVITDDLFVVCKELGWNLKEIETCGGVRSYMKKHLKHGLSFVFDD
jgi:hypothetical protein